MITVQDIIDIYARTGLKPSIFYRDYNDYKLEDRKLIGGCILTAIYCDNNFYDNNIYSSDITKYCAEKLGGIENANGLESGFCGWPYSEESENLDYYRVGKQAAEILFKGE